MVGDKSQSGWFIQVCVPPAALQSHSRKKDCEWSQNEDSLRVGVEIQSCQICVSDKGSFCQGENCCQLSNKAKIPGEETVLEWDPGDLVPGPSSV